MPSSTLSRLQSSAGLSDGIGKRLRPETICDHGKFWRMQSRYGASMSPGPAPPKPRLVACGPPNTGAAIFALLRHGDEQCVQE